MDFIYTAKIVEENETTDNYCKGYYVYSNLEDKHIIIDKDNTPIPNTDNAYWQKIYEIDFSTIAKVE